MGYNVRGEADQHVLNGIFKALTDRNILFNAYPDHSIPTTVFVERGDGGSDEYAADSDVAGAMSLDRALDDLAS